MNYIVKIKHSPHNCLQSVQWIRLDREDTSLFIERDVAVLYFVILNAVSTKKDISFTSFDIQISQNLESKTKSAWLDTLVFLFSVIWVNWPFCCCCCSVHCMTYIFHIWFIWVDQISMVTIPILFLTGLNSTISMGLLVLDTKVRGVRGMCLVRWI